MSTPRSLADAQTRVLFIWQVPDDLRGFLADRLQAEPVSLLFPSTASPEELHELAADADILIGWSPTPELLDTAERMRLFICPAAGVEGIRGLFRELQDRRTFTFVNGHGNSYLVAQHAVSLLLALNNKIVPHHNWTSQGQWRTGDREGASVPLRDRTVGLLGYGAVNRRVHRFLSGFDLSFAALKRHPQTLPEAGGDPLKCFGPEQSSAFLELIDVLMIALPATPETIGVIGSRELARLGRAGLLVNVARGPIVKQADLYDALQRSVIAGAAIDVWYEESPTPGPDGRVYPYAKPFH